MKKIEKLLGKAIKPIVDANGKLYAAANSASERFLGRQGSWVSKGMQVGGKHVRAADAITSARSTLVVPTLWLFSHGYTVLPASLVVANVTLDYVDGIVARHEKKHPSAGIPDTALLKSSTTGRLDETWGAYYDAIADKAFAIPVWMVCFQSFPDSPLLQIGLLSHVAIEGYSSYVRTRAYFREPAPKQWIHSTLSSDLTASHEKNSQGAVESKKNETDQKAMGSSAVVAGIVGKTKQFMAMLGTALVMVPLTKPLGTVLVCVSVPLALASVMQKDRTTVVYAEIATKNLSSTSFEYLQQSKLLGTSLVVGVRRTEENEQHYTDMVNMLRLHPTVDFVIESHNLPNVGEIAHPPFLQRFGIDVVAVPSSASFETVDKHQEDWKSGRIVPVKVDL